MKTPGQTARQACKGEGSSGLHLDSRSLGSEDGPGQGSPTWRPREAKALQSPLDTEPIGMDLGGCSVRRTVEKDWLMCGVAWLELENLLSILQKM